MDDAHNRGGLQAGLIGRGIQFSRSPAMHTGEARAQGVELSYVLIDLDAAPWNKASLPEALDAAEREGFAGVNITYPFKQEVLPLLDHLSPDAERLGAVNTVVFRAGRREGHNTDWLGFAESFRRGLPDVARRQVVQIGAGGAGAAVAYALLDKGVQRLTLIDLDPARAAEVAAVLGRSFGEARATVGADLGAAVATADGVVNATPVGMVKHPGSPIPAELLRPDLWVADAVYVPIETELLASARAAGCRTLDGGGMAVFQAVEAFRLFTGLAPDADRMRAAFLASLDEAPDRALVHE